MSMKILFAPPGFGKTSLLTHMMNVICFDYERKRNMQKAVEKMLNAGFNVSMPLHCATTNYEVGFHQFMYSKRQNYKVNPFKLGFKNEFVKTHFVFPFQAFGITEAQKYLDSHMALYYPRWQSSFYEEHRHDDLDFIFDCQRPELINANVRDLCSFIEIVGLEIFHDKNGKVNKLQWLVKDIPNSSVYENYKNSGKSLKMPERVITADYNVFDIYDSQSCKPKFYEGHFTEDFLLEFGKKPEENIEDYIKYLERMDDELPKGFYQKRSLG